jgi:O-antigen/teichoic acid export membrane protein
MAFTSYPSAIADSAAKPIPESRLGRVVGSDFIQKVSATFGTQLVLVLIGLINTVTVTRVLGPSGRGIYAVAVASGALAVQFSHFGLHVSNTYFVAKDKQLLPALIANSLVGSALVGVVVALVLGVVAVVSPAALPFPTGIGFLLIFWIPIALAYMLLRNLSLAVMDVSGYNRVEIANRCLALILALALIGWGRLNATSAFLASLLALVISFAWIVRRLRAHFTVPMRPSYPLFRRTVSIGMRGYLVCVLSFAVLRIDLLMVKYFLGAESAGYYSVASTLADYVLLLPTVVGSILFPKLSMQSEPSEKFRFAMRSTAVTGAVLLPLIVIAALAASPVIRLIFGSAFLPAATAFIWLLPGIFFLALETVSVQFLNGIGYPKIVIAAWIVATVLNVALNFWAIPTFGIVGASLVSTFTYTTVCLLIGVIIYHHRNGINSSTAPAIAA